MKNLNTPMLVLKFVFMVFIFNSRLKPSLGSESGGDGGDLCTNGKRQSPIDIDVSGGSIKGLPEPRKLILDYKPSAEATLKKRDHDIAIVIKNGQAGSIKITGLVYPLRQMHWHTPSEHSIDNIKYDLELHMVHRTDEGKIAVIAVLYSLGTPDPLIKQLEGSIQKIIDGEKEVNIGEIEPIKYSGVYSYYRYIGSLTTPPCTESVIWNIKKKIRTVSKEQLELLKKAAGGDHARPIQKLNDRNVFFYKTHNLHLESVSGSSTIADI